MMYLTLNEARTRIDDYGLSSDNVLEQDIYVAGRAVDEMSPFKGDKTDEDQEHQFPRDGDTTVPDDVLDFVSLTAYELARRRVEPRPARSISAGDVSVVLE